MNTPRKPRVETQRAPRKAELKIEDIQIFLQTLRMIHDELGGVVDAARQHEIEKINVDGAGLAGRALETLVSHVENVSRGVRAEARAKGRYIFLRDFALRSEETVEEEKHPGTGNPAEKPFETNADQQVPKRYLTPPRPQKTPARPQKREE